MKLRYYQQAAIDSLIFSWDVYDKVLIRAGTGAGKTIIAAKAIEQLLPERCLFLGDSDELCSQPVAAISNHAGVIPGLEKSGERAPLEVRCVVASSQTLSKADRLKRFPRDHFRYIFIDEAHRGSDRDLKICDYFNQAKVCGITATPFRTDMADLSKYFEHIAYSLPMADLMDPLGGLIGKGFAPPWRVLTLPVEIDLKGAGFSQTVNGKEYNSAEADSKIEPYYHKIAELYKEHAEGRHGVAFLVLKESSRRFASICLEHGIRAVHVAGDSPDRVEIIERAKMGEYDLVCNAGVLSTGVDIPIFDAFMCLRPVHSLAWYQQAAGRICRPLDGIINDLTEENQSEERKARIAKSLKPNSLVIDVLWQHDMLGLAHPGHLVATSEEEAQAIYEKTKTLKTERDLFDTAQRVLAAREKNLREALERAAASAKKKMIPAEHLGVLLNNQYLIDYKPSALWEMDKPTPAQVDSLFKMGIDCEHLESKGLATKLIDELFHRKKWGLVSPKQLRLFKRLHIEHEAPEKLTFKAAGRLLDMEFRHKKEKHEAEKDSAQGDFLL